MEPTLEWVEAPPEPKGRGRKGLVRQKVEILKQNPGKWARVETDTYSGKSGQYKGMGCESRSRSTEGSLCDVYARWPEDAEE